MKPDAHRYFRPVGLAFAALLTAQTEAAPPVYYITDLGSLPGCNFTAATDINNQGVVAGYCASADNGNFTTVSGFTWTPATPNGNVGVLAQLDTGMAAVTAINDAGQVVGEKGGNAVLYAPGSGTPVTLPSTAGANHAVATGINGSGQVILNTQTPAAGGFSIPGAAVWTPSIPNGSSGSVRSLGDLGASSETPPNKGTFVLGINNAGQMVGSSLTTANPALQNDFAVLWQPGTTCGTGQASPCTTVGDLAGGAIYSALLAINASGVAVGFGTIAGASSNGFLLRGMISVNGGSPTLLGGTGLLNATDEIVEPYAINDAGIVVGRTSDGEQSKPFWFSNADGWRNLNDLVAADDPLREEFKLTSAAAINNAGLVVGYGERNGERRAFLLTTIAPPPPSEEAEQVPLPAWMLLALPVLLIGAACRRLS